ncbi:hypothetical protein LEN26_013449 [Aphanomyces euteiches]|nr:hypothetical protein LEN26_013449 [Aphanomyces euteiches]
MYDYFSVLPGLSVGSLMTTDPDAPEPSEDDTASDDGENSDLELVSENEPHEPQGEQPTMSSKEAASERIELKTFSRRRVHSAAQDKLKKSTTQADSLLRGLEAVGSGLSSLGSALVSKQGNPQDDILRAINAQTAIMERQANAIERQGNQIEQLLKYLTSQND